MPSTQMVENNKINIKGERPRTRSFVAIRNKGRKKEEISPWKIRNEPFGGLCAPPWSIDTE